MARIPIFDSEAVEGSSGLLVEHSLSQNDWRTSRPVRLSGDQRNVSYEFILSGRNLSAWALEWYQEFWGDNPYINIVGSTGLPSGMRQDADISNNFPGERVFPGSLASYPWAREQISLAGLAGAITHYNITRYVTMTVPSAGNAECRWFPMLVHGYWVRLKIRTTTATAQVSPLPQLRVYAHVGGASELAEYCERLAVPFDWVIPE